jgi:hypothetical protein
MFCIWGSLQGSIAHPAHLADVLSDPDYDPRTVEVLQSVAGYHPAHQRATKALARVASAKYNDTASFRTPRIPEGVSAQPSEPPFSLSQAVI